MFLHFETPFDHVTVRYGLLGLHANAFLHGVFDEADRGCLWYDHEVLRQPCQVRREPGGAMEAAWLGEWLALIRHEGATALRLHAGPYPGRQQHYLLDWSEPGEPYSGQGLILSAWHAGWLGDRCIASWTPVVESSLARETLRDRFPAWRVPVGVPAACCTEVWLRTPQPVPAPRVAPVDLGRCMARLAEAWVLGHQVGYLPAAWPVDPAQRERFLAEWLPPEQVPDTSDPVPAFFQDALAEPARWLFLQAGLLAGALAQVPQREPAHPYDDVNRGPIFPAQDPDGQVFAFIEAAVREVRLPWLRRCFEPLTGRATSEPLSRLRLRGPWDLGFGGQPNTWLGPVQRD